LKNAASIEDCTILKHKKLSQTSPLPNQDQATTTSIIVATIAIRRATGQVKVAEAVPAIITPLKPKLLLLAQLRMGPGKAFKIK